MNLSKEEKIGIAGGLTLATTFVIVGIKIFRKNGKSKKGKQQFRDDLEVIGREHWMSKKSLESRRKLIESLKIKPELAEKFKADLEVIDNKHWMSKDYQEAFRRITDELWNNIGKEGK